MMMITNVMKRFIKAGNGKHNKVVDSFTMNDRRDNAIAFRRLQNNVYTGEIANIKSLEVLILTTLMCVGDLTSMAAPIIDVRYSEHDPSEGIITIFDSATSTVPRGNFRMGWTDAMADMTTKERVLLDRRAAAAAGGAAPSSTISNMFKREYIFDICTRGVMDKDYTFNLCTYLILTTGISWKLKVRLFLNRYKYFLCAMMISITMYIVNTLVPEVSSRIYDQIWTFVTTYITPSSSSSSSTSSSSSLPSSSFFY